MKRLLLLVCIVILMIQGLCQAEAIQDYEDAHKLYIAASASAAAYSDRLGQMAKGYLQRDGWQIDRYAQKNGQAGARFLLAKKNFGGGELTYVLAFVGTETAKDVDFDLKVDKVPFTGNSFEEFAASSVKKGVRLLTTEPQVHRGFSEFLESGLKAKTLGDHGTPLLLSDILLGNRNSKLYLVGHSLGGAAATLAGAGLINMGVNPGQIQVITFGAPAVGNPAFADKVDPLLNLTRVVISGDPVKGIIQTLVGGYKQFGKEIRWKLRDNSDQPHRISEYMDLAMKNNYDKRQQALEAGMQLPSSIPIGHKSGEEVYIAPLKNNLPFALEKEFWYMHQALEDEYRQRMPGCQIMQESDKTDWRTLAAAAGCHWVVVPEVSVTKLKQEQNIYYITFSQTVYEVATGAVVETASHSTATYNLTPLEAFIHDLKDINNNQSSWELRK